MLRKAFQVFEGHSVETVVRAQRIDTVFGMAGVIGEIVGFVPGADLARGEHDAMDGGHHFRESRRAAPVAGCAAVHGVDVHQRDERASGAGIDEHYRLASGILHRGGILRRAFGRASQTGLGGKRGKRRSFDRFNNGGICGHRLLGST